MTRPTTTHKYPRLRYILSVVLLMVFTVAVLLMIKANAAQFDHTQCQYPQRSTNPIDGCDNTDPCDPADAAKGGSGMCCDIQRCTTENVTSQNVADTELPQFSVEKPVDDGDKWGK